MNVDANADIIEADILEMLKHSTVLCSVDVEKKHYLAGSSFV